jgi:hypothetical protein
MCKTNITKKKKRPKKQQQQKQKLKTPGNETGSEE